MLPLGLEKLNAYSLEGNLRAPGGVGVHGMSEWDSQRLIAL